MKKKDYRRKNKNFNFENTLILFNIKLCLSNFIVTMTDEHGKVFEWVSSGSLGFSGFHKNTPNALREIIGFLETKAKEFKINKIFVKIKGSNFLKIELLKLLAESNLKVIKFEDRTSFAFNGCRPQKQRKI